MPGADSRILKTCKPAGARSSACALPWDVHYLSTGGAWAAAVLAADAFAHVLAPRGTFADFP